ncbi:MAG TPA: hypothetical protein VLT84_00655 [Acidobacteriota bacterium]|nr:hypothetical protein [Acidobacteriota bacterium]
MAVIVAALAFAAGMVGPATAAHEPVFDFERSVGLFGDLSDHGLVTDLGDTTLVAGDTLTLVAQFEHAEELTIEAGILSAVVEMRLRDVRDMNFDSASGRGVYRIRAIPAGAAEGVAGLAFVAPRRAFSVRSDRVETDLDGDGLVERYSECASYEGVHFEIWEGQNPYEGKPIADHYYYVPYSLDPTCPWMEGAGESESSRPDSSATTPKTPSR